MNWNTLSRALGNPRGKNANSARQRKGDFGLHTLVPWSSESPECIDIIAIHGLNGHYLNTWTDPKTGFNWLTDVIPNVIPRARVMSFWYNSALQFSKSTSGIRNFGQQLLAAISAERKTTVEHNRPIIVICHSLGGLVFKQAFNRAFIDPDYQSLSNSLSGVLFFGTPHTGSALAPWASTMGKLLKFGSLGTSTNTQLSTELLPKSDVLELISESFKDGCNARDTFRVVSFYETCKMDFLNNLVVERDSATLGIPNETSIALDGDHRSICRFSDADEKRLSPIKERLGALARAAATQMSAPRKAFLDSLNTTSYEVHRNRNPEAVKGTCTWVLDHPTYKSWFGSNDRSLLWISADPGCGKSVLASFLIGKLGASSGQEDINICYFFFKSDNLEQSDSVNCAHALLHQLYHQQGVLAEVGIQQVKDKDLEDTRLLLKAFVLSVEHPQSKKTICVLDGVDECEPLSRAVLLHVLTDACTATGSTSKLKFLVTSRPENQIKVAFDKRPGQVGRKQEDHNRVSMIRLRGEDEIDAINEDIALVVRARIDQLISRGLPAELLDTVEAELIKRADRTFLWISLVLNLLEEKVEEGASRRELDKIIRTRDIYGIYRELLSSRADSARAKKMLSIILGVTRPLTVQELSIALAVPPENSDRDPRDSSPSSRQLYKPLRPGKTNFDDVEYDLVLPFENHIKFLCGHFTRIIRNKVYLVHETAREFLLTPDEIENESSIWGVSSVRPATPTEFDAGRTNAQQNRTPQLLPPATTVDTRNKFQHSFNILTSQRLLLDICTTYLYCLGKTSNYLTRQRQDPSHRAFILEPFLDYAAKSWVIHFQQVASTTMMDDRDLPYYQNLCHPMFPGFQRWTEAFWFPRPLPDHQIEGGDYGMRMEELQDYYVGLFELERAGGRGKVRVGDDDDDHHGQEDEDWAPRGMEITDSAANREGEDLWRNRAGVDDEPGSLGYTHRPPRFMSVRMSEIAMSSLSSHPGSARNHHFPLRVDEFGFVGLDYSAGLGKGESTSR